MDPQAIYNPDYRWITIKTSDGSTLRGKVNVGATERVSDLFIKRDFAFVVLVEVTTDEGGGKTRFVNRDHIVWVEPDDA